MHLRGRWPVGSRKARAAAALRAVMVPALALAFVAVALVPACAPATRSPSLAGLDTAGARAGARYVRSNITRDDYAGSAACGACHADVVARWRASPMHRMTRDIGPAVAQAPFAGA